MDDIDEIVRELLKWHKSNGAPIWGKAAAALAAMKAERDAANEAASMLTTMKQQAEAERDEAMRVLKLANDSCRSAYQIAARKGSETEWETWQFALQKSLNEQHRFMFPEQYSEDRRIRAHDRAATKDAP